MAADPSGAAPICPRVNVPTRRGVLSGTIGTVVSLATRAIAAPPGREIPTFESGQYQLAIRNFVLKPRASGQLEAKPPVDVVASPASVLG